jgi:dsRNA-specific ribonuclease
MDGVQNRLGYRFNEPMFLVQALTHPSYVHGNVWTKAYETLEFLGDAVLG